MYQPKKIYKLGLCFFAIAAFLGTVLRAYPFLQLPLDYKHLMHAHSHIAILGWIYVGLTALLYYIYREESPSKLFKVLFWTMNMSLVGMLCSFPFQGYAFYSIFFSTLFLFVSYGFTYWLLRRNALKKSTSDLFIRGALFYLVLSSLGPWGLGPIIALEAQHTIWYRIAVYFYLHFQYSGWMLMTLLGLLFKFLESRGVSLDNNKSKSILQLVHYSILAGFFMNVLWTTPPWYYYVIAGSSGIVFLIVLGKLYTLLKTPLRSLLNPFQKIVLGGIFSVLLIKTLGQTLGSIPMFMEMITRQLDFVIAYLHLIFLGFISLSLFWFADLFKLLYLHKKFLLGFVLGFVVMEVLLIFRAVNSLFKSATGPYFYLLIVFASALMALSIIGILLNKKRE